MAVSPAQTCDGWQACEKMIHIANHQVSVRIWRKGNFIPCWWECGLVWPLWKAMWRILKTKNRTSKWSSNSTPGYIFEKEKQNKNANSKRYTHPNICGVIVYSCQDAEATDDGCVCQMSGWRSYAYTKWNITQLQKEVRFCHVQWHGWTRRVSC